MRKGGFLQLTKISLSSSSLFFLSHFTQSFQCSMVGRRPKQWGSERPRKRVGLWQIFSTSSLLTFWADFFYWIWGKGVVLCIAGDLAASLPLPTKCQKHTPSVYTKYVFRHGDGRWGKIIPSWQSVVNGTILRLRVNE